MAEPVSLNAARPFQREPGDRFGDKLEHVILYRRPAVPWVLAHMTAQSDSEAILQVARLLALGYTVDKVVPPLADPSDMERAERASVIPRIVPAVGRP